MEKEEFPKHEITRGQEDRIDLVRLKDVLIKSLLTIVSWEEESVRIVYSGPYGAQEFRRTKVTKALSLDEKRALRAKTISQLYQGLMGTELELNAQKLMAKYLPKPEPV